MEQLNSTSLLPRRALMKVPRQQRSIEMVHAILDASRQILERDGLAAFTTNHVADAAGVSVGSLYQYFRNKDALLLGLVERGLFEAHDAAWKSEAVQSATSFEEALTAQLRTLIGHLQPRRASLRELLGGTPLLSETGFMAAVESMVLDCLGRLEAAHGRLPAPPAARFVTVNAMAFTFLRWLTESPAHVREEEFVHSVVQLVVSLQKASLARAS
ncbi:MAG: TetR/AcrR family transcriptional regulator [Polyangiaceae bacterium]|nr:TetR/AcrR family transcriptional regulator [Polyangiaceae bacterium]MCB9605500.1 TetR/AcrR family transcriptional regulator [Polyangiaceae bacterium]